MPAPASPPWGANTWGSETWGENTWGPALIVGVVAGGSLLLLGVGSLAWWIVSTVMVR